jgi:hypothetical protein
MAFELLIGQFEFGDGGSNSGYYDDKTLFDTDHPGLTLEDFAGIAPGGGSIAAPPFTGWSQATTASELRVYDTAALGMPFCGDGVASMVSPGVWTITFDTPVTAAGFNIGVGTVFAGCRIRWFDGATMLHEQTLPGPPPLAVTAFTTFAGYATGGAVPPSDARITADGDTRITGDGDTRIWV